MHAPFNATAVFFAGPGAVGPGDILASDIPCRLVLDPHFKDTRPPFQEGSVYLTTEAYEPNPPFAAEVGPDIWSLDFSQADRLEVSRFPGVIFRVIRVERCDNPTPVYWRASLALDGGPGPSACSAGYAESYTWTDTIGVPVATLVRTGPTTWEGDGWTLTAETEGVDPDTCFSVWTCVSEEGTWAGSWDSGGPTLLYKTPTPDAGRSLYENL